MSDQAYRRGTHLKVTSLGRARWLQIDPSQWSLGLASLDARNLL